MNSFSKLLKRITTLECLFSLDVPIECQKSLPEKESNILLRPSICPLPKPLAVSTMTMCAYFETIVHMKPVFYLFPLLVQDKLSEPKEEKHYKQRVLSSNSWYYRLMSFISSNNIEKHPNYKCSLEDFTKQFERYCARNFKSDVSNRVTLELCRKSFSTIVDKDISYLESSETLQGIRLTPIFPCVLDIKYKDVIRGNIHLRSKKKKKAKRKTAFYNQCTMRIALNSLDRIVNLKIFQNGKIQITGCKSSKDAEIAIGHLLQCIYNLSETMLKKNATMQQFLIHCAQPVNCTLPIEIWEKILMHSGPWDLQKWTPIFPSILNNDSFWLEKSSRDFKYKFARDTRDPEKWKAIEKYNERTRQYKKVNKCTPFEDPKEFYFAHTEEKRRMPFVPLEQLCEITVPKINIEMINSDYETNFNINQEKLTYILRLPPYNLFVKFDPIKYPGVNIKYNCPFPEDNRKDVSIFVFRTGQVIITGGKCMTHITETYKFINAIFQENFKELWIPS
jgi:TATA-box binding protein (TBP) (component of TFIID and TFIIIB)